jgi:hypothetical protein
MFCDLVLVREKSPLMVHSKAAEGPKHYPQLGECIEEWRSDTYLAARQPGMAEEKPRRGDIFVVRAIKKILFLFFGGAAAGWNI